MGGELGNKSDCWGPGLACPYAHDTPFVGMPMLADLSIHPEGFTVTAEISQIKKALHKEASADSAGVVHQLWLLKNYIAFDGATWSVLRSHIVHHLQGLPDIVMWLLSRMVSF